MTINKLLKWDIHVAITVKKVWSIFCKFKTLSSFLLPITMKMIYCALAKSVYS